MGSGIGWRAAGVVATSGVTAEAILTCREGALVGAALALATTGETVLGGDRAGEVLRL